MSAEEYLFHLQEGLDCACNVTVLVKFIANATQLLPSVLSVACPHSLPCDEVESVLEYSGVFRTVGYSVLCVSALSIVHLIILDNETKQHMNSFG